MITKTSTAALHELLVTTLDELDARAGLDDGPSVLTNEGRPIETGWAVIERTPDVGWLVSWPSERERERCAAEYRDL